MRRIVCIGGGTGIAPFVSFAQHLHAVEDKREIVVLHGASYVDELSYKELLTDLENDSIKRGKDEWNFKYRAAISRPQEWFNRSCRITSYNVCYTKLLRVTNPLGVKKSITPSIVPCHPQQ